MAQNVQEYAARQREHNEAMSKSIDEIADDMKRQTELIAQIQNSPGRLSPEDQQALDELDSGAQSLVQRLQAVNDMTPPPVPVGGGDTGGTGGAQPGTVGNI